MSEPEWLKPDVVVELNAYIVGSTGEPFHLRDTGLLEGALGRVRDNWAYSGETDVVSLAVTLIFAKNHPFAQGNKRTAFEAAILFLELNGYDWLAPDDVEFAEHMIAVIEGESSLLNFADLFTLYVVEAADSDDGVFEEMLAFERLFEIDD